MPACTEPIKPSTANILRVVEPFESRMVARHQLVDDVRHDRHPVIAVSEDNDGRPIRQRAYHEGFEAIIVAPMEEKACIRFKTPAQAPCDVLIGILGIRCVAFDAVLSKPYLRIKPLFGRARVEARAG